ncbi:metallophosphoesterase [Uliginosibacterium gangwonense]|uniref:metallophosphoesterase n=1 Tax=Uliginosibacterium gangwonense TaxID=392736 RepID=UPI000363E836|nr:metallophosphoesterase [Uliginosibacterium gangwonense]
MVRSIRITILLLCVLSVLALLHAYIGMHVVADLGLPHGASMLAWGGLIMSCLLIPAGMLTRLFEDHPLADALAWLGMSTMGLFSSLLVLTFIRDMALLVADWLDYHSVGLLTDTAIAVPLLAVLATLLGMLNARRLAQVVDVEVPLKGLPAALEGFKIAQISDIHVGPTIKRDYLMRIVERVNTLGADMVAITGDLVDGSVAELTEHTAPLALLRARHGTFFVTGNHEYYANAPAWIEEIRRLGLRVLINEHVLLDHDGQKVVVAGVTDYTAHQFDSSHRSDPHAAMAGAPADAGAKLLLAHQPRSATAAAAAGFDLQLSGHTHGGQFLPWNLFVPLQQPFIAGLHRLQNLWVYVSRGTGYWGPPKRLGAPSEITCLRLVSAGS